MPERSTQPGLPCFPARFDDQRPPGLHERLQAAWEAGRAAWPTVHLDAERFIAPLLAQLPPLDNPGALERFFERLVPADFYLACACAHEDRAALAALEHHYLVKLPLLLAPLHLPEELVKDIGQLVRTKLLVRQAAAAPKIAEYAGHGALINWLRVAALRTAVSLLRRTKDPTEDNRTAALDALPAPDIDPELDLIKRSYQEEFSHALHEAFATLSEDERHILRLYFVDRLSTPELGVLFGKNQSTIWRWIQQARQRVHDETKTRLKQRLRLSSAEFESLLQVIDSQLDFSISQILGSDDPSASNDAERMGA